MADRILADRYAVEKKLGEGGMAEVFLVHDALERRPLALKLLKAGDPGRDYFMHEFQVLARLDHPNLVRVYDFQTCRLEGQDTCFYTCELLEGRDLFQATRDMDWDGLYEVVRHVLEALAYIHDRGLVHYDVKPENINVAVIPASRPGGRPSYRVKLMDFGLTGEATTRGGEKIKGTVHYVAPEVAKSLPADRRSDLYSLGIALYYVVTGKLPYDGGSALSIIRKHLERVPEPPTQVRPDVPEAWQRFVLRLIEKEPARRYSTAPEALADLSRRLSKAYTQQERAATPALTPSFVGREALLERLIDLLPAAPPPDAPPEPESTEMGALPLAPRSLPPPPPPGAKPVPCVVWIEGEEGVGKTRLVYELRVRAQVHGVPVLDATCLREGDAPFQRIVRMALMIPGARALAAATLPDLEALFPGFAARVPGAVVPAGAPVGTGDDRRLVLDRVAELLIRVARLRPYLLVLEDLRGADETTRALLGALVRSIAFRRRKNRVPLVVLTDRKGGDDPPGELGAAIDLISGQRLLERLSVECLDRPATGKMLASMLALAAPADALSRAVHEATGGNPFFVEELVKSLAEDGVLSLRRAVSEDELGKVVAPRSLGELLGQRLSRLPDDARAVLAALAVLEAPSRLKVVAHTAAHTPAASLDALDLLIRQQMVIRQDDVDTGPPRYRLSHGLVQRTALEKTGRAAITEAHRRALAALEAHVPEKERVDVLERLARHADEGGDRVKALTYSTAAGMQALSRGGPHEAIEHLGRALELLRWEDVIPSADERRKQELTLLTRLSEGLATIGRYKDAARALEELLGVLDEGGESPGSSRWDAGVLGPQAAVWIRRRLGDLALKQGDAAQARRWLQEALTAAGDASERRGERARVLEVMSRMALWRGDYLQVIALAGEAVDIFRALKREPDAQWALHILATAEHYRGRADRAADLLDECLSLVRGRSSSFIPALSRLGYDDQAQPDLDRALKKLGQRPAVRREAGDAFGLVLSFSELGTCFDTRADAGAAIEFYAATLEASERLGDAQRTALSLNNLGIYRRLEGKLAQGLEDLERSLAIHEGTGDRQGAAVALLNLALLRLALGDHEGALLRARRALAIARDLGLTWLTGHCHRVIGRALLQHGDAEEGDRELLRAVGVFGMIGNARSLGDALLERAEVAATAGKHDAAQELLRKAKGTDDAKGADFQCRQRLVEGMLLLDREPARALDALDGALRHARAAGVIELRLEAHRVLAHAHARLGTLRAAQEHHDRSIELADALLTGLDDELRERAGRTPGAQRARLTSRMLVERMLDE